MRMSPRCVISSAAAETLPPEPPEADEYDSEEDVLDHAYTLEVSSPGLDRPLRKAADFVRFAGEEAELRLVHPVDNAKKLKGTLRGCGDAGGITPAPPEAIRDSRVTGVIKSTGTAPAKTASTSAS